MRRLNHVTMCSSSTCNVDKMAAALATRERKMRSKLEGGKNGSHILNDSLLIFFVGLVSPVENREVSRTKPKDIDGTDSDLVFFVLVILECMFSF